MDRINLQDSKVFNSHKFLWMMKDKKFYEKIVELIRNKYIIDHAIWKYGFYHNNGQVAKEFIQRYQDTLYWFDSIRYLNT